jgi:hypothetical protein
VSRTEALRAGSGGGRTLVSIEGPDLDVLQELALAVRERCIQLGMGFDIEIGDSRHVSAASSPRGVVEIRTRQTPQGEG